MEATILTGGPSPERYVSYASAANARAELLRHGVAVSVFDVGDDGSLRGAFAPSGDNRHLIYQPRRFPASSFAESFISSAKQCGISAQPLLCVGHGGPLEDGTVVGILECLGGRGVLADSTSLARSFNKEFARKTLSAQGIPFLEAVILPSTRLTVAELGDAIQAIGGTAIVKPAACGSSIGLWGPCSEADSIAAHLPYLASLSDVVIVERFAPGRELTCAMYRLGKEVVIGPAVEKHRRPGQAISHDYKYGTGKGGRKSILSRHDPVTRSIEEILRLVSGALPGLSCCRADFVLEGELPYLLDVNPVPFMASDSTFSKVLEFNGHSLGEWLLDRIVNGTVDRDAYCG